METKLVIHNILDEHADHHPETIAIEEQRRSVTYSAFREHTRFIADSLAGSNILPADVVGVYLESSIDYVAAITGINKAGAVFMPMELNYPAERMAGLLRAVQPKMIITRPALQEQLCGILQEGCAATTIALYDHEQKRFQTGEWKEGRLSACSDVNAEPGRNAVRVGGDDSNYLMYTSGSTGVPKIIEGLHKSLSHFIHWEVAEFVLGHTARVSQLAPLSFDVSLRDIFVPLLAGGTLCIPPAGMRKEPDQLINWLAEKKVTLMHTVPSLFRLMTDAVQKEGVEKLASLRHILLAGEALYSKDVIRWRNVAGESVEMVNLYGPSETTLAKVFHRIKQVEQGSEEIIPLGTPLPNTQVMILQNDTICKAGAAGEIHIRTPFRSKGYYKNPELTKEKFIQNPLHNNYTDIIYRTGDMGRWSKEGALIFIGREDGQVKIRGNRVEISEVEEVLRSFPGILQVLVHPFTNSNQEVSLILYYTNETEIGDGTFRSYIAGRLPEYMHPAFYFRLREFPLSLNGKTDRKLLPKPDELIYQSLKYEAPVNETERRLSLIWADVLGIRKVGRNNSFFEMGGHSLTAFKIVTLMSKEFEKDISLKQFFEFPKISDLARLINEEELDEIVI